VVLLAGSSSIASAQIFGNLKLGSGVVAPATNSYTGTLTTNFTASYPLPAYPTTTSVSRSYHVGASIPGELPRSGDLPATDGRHYYFCSGATIGSVNNLTGKNVAIVGTNTGMSAGLAVQGTGTCDIYLDKAVVLATGKVINDGGWAGALNIYASTSSTCSFANNSRMTACLYAPSAPGGGGGETLTGIFVAKTITLSRNRALHFDESLTASSGPTGWSVTGWLALESAADRASVAGLTGNYLQ